MENNFKKCIEGIVITLIGIIAIVCSLGIQDNPVKMSGWVGFVAQARFFPLLTGVLITVLGLRLTFFLNKNTDKSLVEYDINKKEFLNILILICIVCLYLLGVTYIGFAISTLVYLFVIMFYLNYKKYKTYIIIGIIIVFFVVSNYAIPAMLRINMP